MITRILDGIEKLLSIIVSILIAIMTASTFYQVVLRYVFKGGNVWSEELTRYAFVWVVMLGSVIAIRRARHMRIDFFVNTLSPKKRKIADVFAYSIMTIFLVGIIIYGINIVSMTGRQISPGLKIPMSYMYSSIPISAILMLSFAMENVVKIIKNQHESLE